MLLLQQNKVLNPLYEYRSIWIDIPLLIALVINLIMVSITVGGVKHLRFYTRVGVDVLGIILLLFFAIHMYCLYLNTFPNLLAKVKRESHLYTGCQLALFQIKTLIFGDSQIVYGIAFIIMGILGLFAHPFLFGFHLTAIYFR
jgi:hypothetical protein